MATSGTGGGPLSRARGGLYARPNGNHASPLVLVHGEDVGEEEQPEKEAAASYAPVAAGTRHGPSAGQGKYAAHEAGRRTRHGQPLPRQTEKHALADMPESCPDV